MPSPTDRLEWQNPRDTAKKKAATKPKTFNPEFKTYTQAYPDLQKNYQDNWASKGMSPSEYGSMHYKAYGEKEGRSLSGPAKSKSSSARAPAPAPATAPAAAAAPAPRPEIKYEGPAPSSTPWQQYDPTPIGIEKLEPLISEVITSGPRSEVVENRVASLIDTNSPLFRAAASSAQRSMATSGLSNSSMAQEAVMDSIFKIATPIAMADAQTFSKQRMLNQGMTNEFRAAENASFYEQMGQRLDGAIKETLSHIAGGYALTQEKINDVTKRYIADLTSATQIKTSQMGMDTNKYMADMDFALGQEGIKLDAAKLLNSIKDNPSAAQQTWNMIFSENVSPAEHYSTWERSWREDGTPISDT